MTSTELDDHGPHLADFHWRGTVLDDVDAVEGVRLLDACARLAPSWMEAVAIVRAVCAQLEPGEMPPAVGDIVLGPRGEVAFPLAGIADADVAIQAMARLLSRLLGEHGCPLQVWDANERAQRDPMAFGSARGFGEALTCVPDHRVPKCLAAYLRHVKAAPATAPSRRPARGVGLTARLPQGLRRRLFS